ncbi:MAG TPA: hypothetical protein VIL35_07940 [Vicinamibacterales bacterium]
MLTLRSTAALACAAAIAAAAGAAPHAWGFDAHRFVVSQAIELLPGEIRPFFIKHRVSLVEHAIDPDLWRNAGWTAEPPRHFLDLDAYGEPPYNALPRDYDQAVAKFGREMVDRNGLLPWRLEEMYGKLVGAFADQKAGRPFAPENIKFFTSVVAHYVSDAHVPLHAVVNYDGQLTGQQGIHSRLETELFERYQSKLAIRPVKVAITSTPRDFAFDTLITSAGLADEVLAADLAAIGDGEVYDDAYFDRLFARLGPMLERRVNESIASIAAIVTRAWEEAGKPELPVNPPPREPRKRRAEATK